LEAFVPSTSGASQPEAAVGKKRRPPFAIEGIRSETAGVMWAYGLIDHRLVESSIDSKYARSMLFRTALEPCLFLISIPASFFSTFAGRPHLVPGISTCVLGRATRVLRMSP
jgi:hypothetical protein